MCLQFLQQIRKKGGIIILIVLSFSCGPLGNVKSPFRQASDPPRCGYKSYELICSDTKAMIRIDNAAYYVSSINYSSSSFWVVHADLDLYNNCPVPQWNLPYQSPDVHAGMDVELAPLVDNQACFVQCSQEVVNQLYCLPEHQWFFCLRVNWLWNVWNRVP